RRRPATARRPAPLPAAARPDRAGPRRPAPPGQRPRACRPATPPARRCPRHGDGGVGQTRRRAPNTEEDCSCPQGPPASPASSKDFPQAVDAPTPHRQCPSASPPTPDDLDKNGPWSAVWCPLVSRSWWFPLCPGRVGMGACPGSGGLVVGPDQDHEKPPAVTLGGLLRVTGHRRPVRTAPSSPAHSEAGNSRCPFSGCFESRTAAPAGRSATSTQLASAWL